MFAPPLRFALAFAVGLALLAPAAGSEAQTRVVVENFRGPQGARIRGHAVAALSGEGSIEVVPRAEVNDAADGLGLNANRLSEDEYPQVAQELNVAAFVRGRVSRRGRRWSATILIINGADGAELGRETWSGRTVSNLGAVRRNGYTRLEPHLSSASAPAARETDEPDPNHWAYGNADDEEEAPPGDGEEDEEDESEPVEAGSRYDSVAFEILGGFLHRSMSATATVLNNGRDPTGPATLEEVRSYTSAGIGHGELGFRLSFFPGAIPESQPVPWFGALFELRHSVGLTSRGCPQDEPCLTDDDRIDVGTEQFELYLGLQARFRFGEQRGALTLWANAGYGVFGFLLDTEALMDLERPSVIPPIQYSFIHLGAGLSAGLVPARYRGKRAVYLTAGLRLAYRAGLGVGNDAAAIWGVQTGGGPGFQFAIDLSTEMPYIAEGVFLGLTFEYFVFTTTWQGQTQCLVPAPCADTDLWEPWPYDPANMDVVTGGIESGVNDNYIRLNLSIGYAFR